MQTNQYFPFIYVVKSVIKISFNNKFFLFNCKSSSRFDQDHDKNNKHVCFQYIVYIIVKEF